MTHRLPNLKVDLYLLRHKKDVCTLIMFDKFQNKWVKSILVMVIKCKEEGFV